MDQIIPANNIQSGNIFLGFVPKCNFNLFQIQLFFAWIIRSSLILCSRLSYVNCTCINYKLKGILSYRLPFCDNTKETIFLLNWHDNINNNGKKHQGRAGPGSNKQPTPQKWKSWQSLVNLLDEKLYIQWGCTCIPTM